jgi:putative DNA primase/helicase
LAKATCESDPQAKEKVGDLYASWKAWADRSGEFAGSMKMFSQKLIDRDYGQWRTGSARGFVGLRIVPVDSILHWSGRSDGCDR